MTKKLVYATSIKERIDHLSNSNYSLDIANNVSKWLERKSLCTEELFDFSLEQQQMNREQFNLGIKELDENDVSILEEAVNQSDWYKKTQEIFMQKDFKEISARELDFSYAIRFHAKYFLKEIEQIHLKNIELDDYTPFFEHLCKEMIDISAKTLVYDLHQQKKLKPFKGETSNERFIYYMNYRFGTSERAYLFFEDYPVLARLLAQRISFHIENYVTFVNALEDSKGKIRTVFGIDGKLKISQLSLGEGDSHSQGKTVILFRLNDKKFVFKFKNLEVGERLNQFFDFLREETGKKFAKIKRISMANFTIEEFIEKKECRCEKEVSKFYHRFGEYVAITYLLCSNDFHFENLVAHSEFPVLIDIETILQNESPLKRSDNPFVKLSFKKHMSVLSTGLLPVLFQENRIEPLVAGKKQGIRMSALDGRQQKLPFKVLTLIEPNTDNVRFTYKEHTMSGSNNIPILNGEEVDFNQYKHEIIQGFEEICRYFMENREKVNSMIETIFSDLHVRNVIKATQKYGDMLQFGYHPKYMTNYVEREKLFENLWSFGYRNKVAIQSEINELLVNDIPIFFNNTSDRHLISGSGVVYHGYYEGTALERVTNRITTFDEEEFSYQKMRLALSLGIYDTQVEAKKLGSTVDENIHAIAKEIIDRAHFDREKKMVTFEDFTYSNTGVLDYNALTSELYDGLSGIYLFLLYYCQQFESQEGKKLLSIMETMMFVEPKKMVNIPAELSAYYGKYTILYPLYHKYKLTKEEKYLKLAKQFTEGILQEIHKNEEADWLTGISGLIKVLVNYYEETKESIFLQQAELLAEKIDIEQIKLCGFSHGFSGVIHTLHGLYRVTKNDVYLKLFQQALTLENTYFNGKYWQDLREDKQTISRWCHGTVGIGMSRLFLLENNQNQLEIQSDLAYCIDNVVTSVALEDGLCHGNMGAYWFLAEVIRSEKVNNDQKEVARKKQLAILSDLLSIGVRTPVFGDKPTLGLMTGIAGIGLGLLKEKQEEIPNPLTLD